MALRRLDLTTPEPPADYPAPSADGPPQIDPGAVAIAPGEDLNAYFERMAPLLATSQVAMGLAGDGKAARWILELTSAGRDRLSTVLPVTHEDLCTAEGTARVMRSLAVMALRGDLGLTEARRATDLVKESAESMFADEIRTMRDAIENARRFSHRPLRAVAAEAMSRGAIGVEEADEVENVDELAVPLLSQTQTPAVVDVAPTPSWGRFAAAKDAAS